MMSSSIQKDTQFVHDYTVTTMNGGSFLRSNNAKDLKQSTGNFSFNNILILKLLLVESTVSDGSSYLSNPVI